MIESNITPIHALPSGLCEDPSGEATALISRMAGGDGGALAELHEMWAPILLGIASRMLGDPQAAEKAIEDTFVRMWQRSADYSPHRSPPFVWAFGILRSHCIDRLRFENPAKTDPPPERTDLPAAPATENPRVISLSDWRRVRTAVDQLSPEEICCLESAVFLEYTHSETSEPLNPPLGTVKNRLRKTLEKLRNQLSRYEL